MKIRSMVYLSKVVDTCCISFKDVVTRFEKKEDHTRNKDTKNGTNLHGMFLLTFYTLTYTCFVRAAFKKQTR